MDLNLQMNQSQILSPRMIQSASVLQMTTQELQNYIGELALENPVIDLPDGSDLSQESIEQKEFSCSLNEEKSYLSQRQNNDDDYDFRDAWNFSERSGDTLAEYLWSQLLTEKFTDEETRIIRFLLESLDSRGYLTETAASAATCLKARRADVRRMIARLQALEPAGVCCRDLKECLRLQLERRKLDSPVMLQLIDECLELMAKGQIPAIARRLRLSQAEAAGLCEIVRSLTPKPGAFFADRERLRYIIPDVTVVKFEGHYDILLNDARGCSVRINSYYQNLSREENSPEVAEYLSGKLKQAEWVKQCVAMRRETILKVTREILKHQSRFFAEGPRFLVPLRQSDIAGALGIHDSTVSRTANRKYLQCSWGIFPMNYFFSRNALAETAHSAPEETNGTEGESGVTAARIREILRELIRNEDKKKPLSDRLLAEMLAGRGITISRRTVAKYRGEDGIPGVTGRKQYE